MSNVYKQYVCIRWNFLCMHKILDLFLIWQCIPTYCSVFVTCLKLISILFSVHQRTCWIYHKSAYVGAMSKCNRALTLKAPESQLRQTTNFVTSFQIFEINKVWYLMRIVCQQTILMKYHALLLFLKKRLNLKLLSAANYRWRFMG